MRVDLAADPEQSDVEQSHGAGKDPLAIEILAGGQLVSTVRRIAGRACAKCSMWANFRAAVLLFSPPFVVEGYWVRPAASTPVAWRCPIGSGEIHTRCPRWGDHEPRAIRSRRRDRRAAAGIEVAKPRRDMRVNIPAWTDPSGADAPAAPVAALIESRASAGPALIVRVAFKPQPPPSPRDVGVERLVLEHARKDEQPDDGART